MADLKNARPALIGTRIASENWLDVLRSAAEALSPGNEIHVTSQDLADIASTQ